MLAVARRSLSALLVAGLAAAALSTPAAPAGEDGPADTLARIDEALKGLRGVTADIAVTDVRDGREETSPEGQAWIQAKSGKVRLEATGEVPKIFIVHPGTMWIHRPVDMTVDQFDLRHHRGRLAPYTVLGFAVAGSDLEKDYDVAWLGEADLDGTPTVRLELTPRSDTVRTYLHRVELWLDPDSWLPVQQRMHHHAGDTRLTVRYTNLARVDRLDGKLFQPRWPRGTEVRKK